MPAHTARIVAVWTGLCFAGAHLTRAQEATSANLPDQFQTGEMIQIQKPKKKKAESNSQTVATAPEEDSAPVPMQMPAAIEATTHVAPPEEEKADRKPSTVSMPPSQKSTLPSEQPKPSAEEQEVVAVPPPKKPRLRKRRAPVAHPEAPRISSPVAMSFSVAQSMALTAPMPDYTYEMKRRNLAGSGVCFVTVDPATGTVTNATMSQSTGSPLLDKVTTQTFKSWRFKPGTVSEVRIPISYE